MNLIDKYLGEAKYPKDKFDEVTWKKGKYSITAHSRAGEYASPDWMEVILHKGSISILQFDAKYYPDKQIFVIERKKKFKKIQDVWKYVEKKYKEYPDKPPLPPKGAGPSLAGLGLKRKHLKDIGD